MRAFRYSRIAFLCALLTVFVVSSCRSAGPPQPTDIPTATYTPRSTPLPTVATPPPPGTTDNPIQLFFVRPAAVSRGTVTNAARDLETILSETASLSVNIEIAETGAEAVAALCDSPGGVPAAAWVDSVTYAAARICAESSLAVVREDGVGADVSIIVPQASEAETIRDLAGAVFCRLSVNDLYTWLIPSLVLQANSVSPTSLGVINDYEDLGDLVSAVGAGDCDAAGVNLAELEAVGGSSRIRELGTSIRVPYPILMIAPSIPLGTRNALTDALVAIAADSVQAELLDPLLDQVRFATTEDLESWDAFLRRTRLDFSEMAR